MSFQRPLTRALSSAPPAICNLYAMMVAFATYFCMYAFRKPFAAATYEGLHLFDTGIELKTAFVISQIIGYTVSKFIGIKFCSEASRGRRVPMLIGLIVAAELALVLFAVLPTNWKVAAIFLNGLPLGMVWGLVVWYLEGRTSSDMLLAGLSCSFIVSSGVVKDVGRALMVGDSLPFFGFPIPNPLPVVTEFWMPAVTGLLFLPIFLVAVWLLDQVPDPTPSDIAARTLRQPMNRQRRQAFVMRYLPGVAMLMAAYFFLTAFRDFRDNYTVEMLDQLGYKYAEHKDIISRMELCVAFGVMVVVALPFLIRDNRQGLTAIFSVMIAGMLLLAAATAMLDAGIIDGFWWMMLIGLGSYLAYVPYNSVLFDRLIASTGFVGTAVFAIYLADTLGYSGSILVQLAKDLASSETSRLDFMRDMCYFTSLFGAVTLTAGCVYFVRRHTTTSGSPIPLVLTSEYAVEIT